MVWPWVPGFSRQWVTPWVTRHSTCPRDQPGGGARARVRREYQVQLSQTRQRLLWFRGHGELQDVRLYPVYRNISLPEVQSTPPRSPALVAQRTADMKWCLRGSVPWCSPWTTPPQGANPGSHLRLRPCTLPVNASGFVLIIISKRNVPNPSKVLVTNPPTGDGSRTNGVLV